jgi:IS605 OrfB family transposase
MAETTTRAYTLKLQGDRLALWRNHVAFNKGVRVWGEWLLNLRGGLPAGLADDKELLAITASDVTKATKEQLASITAASVRLSEEFANATDKAVQAEVKARKALVTEARVHKQLLANRKGELRRILALSWLSAETPVGLVPEGSILAGAEDAGREAKVLERFRDILKRKKASDPGAWLDDCGATLRAAIRPDAVWVDRSMCFRSMPAKIRPSEDEAAKNLFALIGSQKDYFATLTADEAEDKNYSTTCGNWISKCWGEGAKSDDAHIIRTLGKLKTLSGPAVVGGSGSKTLGTLLTKCRVPSDGDFLALCAAIGWRGKPNKTRIALEKLTSASRVSKDLWQRFVDACADECRERKVAKEEAVPPWVTVMKDSLPAEIGIPFRPATGRSHHFEFATMLAFAMRRVSQIHTKAKQAEAERRSFAPEQSRIRHVPVAARAWLTEYVSSRSTATGAIDGYQLRKRALGGWSETVSAWAHCETSEDRISTVRELQADWEKPGDVQLFEALAADDAICVWRTDDGKSDPAILSDFVRAQVADRNAIRFKVPAYRHPDPLRSPSFIGFGNSQWSIGYSAQDEAQARKKHLAKLKGSPKEVQRATEALAQEPILQDVCLELWGTDSLQAVRYRWQSTRLLNDLALSSLKDPRGESVTRASRLGRAHAGVGPVVVDGITDDGPWNGRLQAPRRELEDLARALDGQDLPYEDESVWPKKLQTRLAHLNWFLSHSAKLTPRGPWLDYVAKGLAEGWQWANGRSGSYLFREDNKARKGKAKLILSRLPGLRVLSVDLGIRTSAAAAVWQVVSKREMTAAKERAKKVREGDLSCLITEGKKTTVYRRIGPSAWARLDRQFLIELDGEKASARPATAEEWDFVQKLRSWLGCVVEPRPARLPPVDGLQQSAEKLCRLGLRRLSDLARVAYLLSASERPIMGGRMASLSPTEQITAAQDALVIWHTSASSDEFVDPWLRDLWQTHIGSTPVLASRLTKKQRGELRDALLPVAQKLHGNKHIALQLAEKWQEQSAKWREQLKSLRRWVIPRFNKRVAGHRVRIARDVGGLSLDRISTIRGVYQLMRAYASRPEPTNLRAGVERLEEQAAKKLRPEFGRRMLSKMERLRENRVKQIASRIVEAAMGIGSEDRSHWVRGRRRAEKPIADPRFAPCHAVVIESLENYRPDEKRTRRENRGLMSWAARAIQKYLSEGCELHGLYLREVMPNYTSRQDSRTGAPGLRCNDVPVAAFTDANGWIGRLVARAELAMKDGKATPRQQLLVALLEAIQSGEIKKQAVRIIAPGGQLFVAADKQSPAANGIHADLNAAANIGLVALLDPDWPASWWRLPCNAQTGELNEEKVQGSEAFAKSTSILAPDEQTRQLHVNAWSDPCDSAISRRDWVPSKEYWSGVEVRVAKLLQRWNFG